MAIKKLHLEIEVSYSDLHYQSDKLIEELRRTLPSGCEDIRFEFHWRSGRSHTTPLGMIKILKVFDDVINVREGAMALNSDEMWEALHKIVKS